MIAAQAVAALPVVLNVVVVVLFVSPHADELQRTSTSHTLHLGVLVSPLIDVFEEVPGR